MMNVARVNPLHPFRDSFQKNKKKKDQPPNVPNKKVLRGVAFCKPFNLIWAPHKKAKHVTLPPFSRL